MVSENARVNVLPFLTFLMSLLGFINIKADKLVSEFASILPQQFLGIFDTFVHEVFYEKYGSILSISFLISIYSASSGFRAIIKGINKAHEQEEKRNFVVVHLISMGLIKISGQEPCKTWFSMKIPHKNHEFGFTFLTYAIYKNNVDCAKKLFHSELYETLKTAAKSLRVNPLRETKRLEVEGKKTEPEEVIEMLRRDPHNRALLSRRLRLYMPPRTGLTPCKTCGSLCPGGYCDNCDPDSGEDWDD